MFMDVYECLRGGIFFGVSIMKLVLRKMKGAMKTTHISILDGFVFWSVPATISICRQKKSPTEEYPMREITDFNYKESIE